MLSGGLLVVSNAVLQTPLVRHWFERKLERKSGLDWTIRYLSWTPWTGVQVGGVTAALAGGAAEGAPPVYEVGEMDVAIYWDALWRGLVAPREVRLRNVRAAVPIELMDLLGGPPRPAAPAPAPLVVLSPEAEAATEPEPGGADPANSPPKPRPPVRNAPSSESPAAPSPEPATTVPDPEAAAIASQATSAPPVPERPAAGRPFTLVVEDAEVSLYSLTGRGKGGLALQDVRGEVALGGEDAPGWIDVGAVTFGGRPVSESFRIGLQWSRPFLLVPPRTYEWSGLEIQAGASLRARGAPLAEAEVRLAPRALDPVSLPPWPALTVSASSVEMSSRFRGNLLDVASWRGDSRTALQGLLVRQEGGRGEATFDLGRLTAVLQGRAVQVVDGRLLSERLSFLGNGVALPDGRVFATLRVVADRDYTETLTRVAVGSFLARGWTQSWFEPLLTPDRHFRDLHVLGTTRALTIDVGRRGEEVPLSQAWEHLVAFVNAEAEETAQGVAPSPPRERIWTPPLQ